MIYLCLCYIKVNTTASDLIDFIPVVVVDYVSANPKGTNPKLSLGIRTLKPLKPVLYLGAKTIESTIWFISLCGHIKFKRHF